MSVLAVLSDDFLSDFLQTLICLFGVPNVDTSGFLEGDAGDGGVDGD